jgi:hypothetical protein
VSSFVKVLEVVFQKTPEAMSTEQSKGFDGYTFRCLLCGSLVILCCWMVCVRSFSLECGASAVASPEDVAVKDQGHGEVTALNRGGRSVASPSEDRPNILSVDCTSPPLPEPMAGAWPNKQFCVSSSLFT